MNTQGYTQLLGWLESFGPVARVGIEGTGSYGAGLSRFLTAASVEVLEVNRPERSNRRLRGKTDAVDAEAAVRAVLSGQASAIPKAKGGVVEASRLLRMVYCSAVRDRTGAIDQFHAVLTTAAELISHELGSLGMARRVDMVLGWRQRRGDGVLGAIIRRSLKELGERIVMLDHQADRLVIELAALVESTAAALVDLPGVGIHTAAELLMAAGGNPARIRNEAAFAQLCGAAPISVSSGKTSCHGLSCAGNRAANNALWRIVMA